VSDRRGFGIVGVIGIVISVGSAALAAPRPWANKVPPEMVKAVSPLPQTPDTQAAGKDVYTNTCLPCHGPGAQGDGPASEFIKPKPKPLVIGNKLSLPDGVAFWVVTNGIDNTGMAAFADQLSETERWQAIAYLHTIAGDAGGSPAIASGAATPAPAASSAPAGTPAAGATPASAGSAAPTATAAAAATATPAPGNGGSARAGNGDARGGTR